MLSLNRLTFCILAITLLVPLRCTSLNFSISSAVPATVEWTRNDTDPPGQWKVIVTLNGSNNSPFEPPNPSQPNGSFLLSQAAPQYQPPLESVTLVAFAVQSDGSEGRSFRTETVQIATDSITTTKASPSLGSSTLTVISVVSTPTAVVPSGGPHKGEKQGPYAQGKIMHGNGPPKSSTNITIIGAVLGSVAILLIVAIVFFLWWRNRRRRLRKTYPAQFSGEKMVREVGPANYTSNILLKHQSMSSDSCYTESFVYSEDGGRPPTLEGLDARVHEV